MQTLEIGKALGLSYIGEEEVVGRLVQLEVQDVRRLTRIGEEIFLTKRSKSVKVKTVKSGDIAHMVLQNKKFKIAGNPVKASQHFLLNEPFQLVEKYKKLICMLMIKIVLIVTSFTG
ncbi:hypothetical protein O6P43_009702 [Quillaja saponaria]|uniref:Uncharacterized protein n=1 Tax=Quillaja saponaria TaxID=32244 RepID=A0AAD7PYV9_QUISA|nr:hypothetical protein O6P43_009702 [Quillaja saponaria]